MAKLATWKGRRPKAARGEKRGRLGTRLRWRYGDMGGRCGAASLEAAQIIPGRGVRRAPEELGKRFDVADLVGLRLVADGADGHVLDHAAAKIADGLLAHRGAPGPEVEVQQPLDPHDRALPIPLPPSHQTPPFAVNLSAKLARSAFVH